MASKTAKFEYDGIVLHSDDEYLHAQEFCNNLMDKIGLDPPLNIITFEEFSHPGKTEVDNLTDAVESAEFIFCSEYHFHSDQFGAFAGQVAIMEKLPDKMIKVRTGRGVCKNPVMRAFKGIELQENWRISEPVLDKLRKIFSADVDDANDRSDRSAKDFADQITAMPELPYVGYPNPRESLSARSSQSSFLDVQNPSLSTESDVFGESAREEAEHQAFTPQARTSFPRPQKPSPITQSSGSGKPDLEWSPVSTSTNLPSVDLAEDGEVSMPRNDTVIPETSGKVRARSEAQTRARAQAQTVPTPLQRRGQSQAKGEQAPVSATTGGEEDRSLPSVSDIFMFCTIIFVFCSIIVLISVLLQ